MHFTTVILFVAGCVSELAAADKLNSAKVTRDGVSVLSGKAAGRAVRVTMRTSRVDIGDPSQPVPVVRTLTLVGGDGSEGYEARVYFDSSRVRKRELYASEAGSLMQTTTYTPPPVLD